MPTVPCPAFSTSRHTGSTGPVLPAVLSVWLAVPALRHITLVHTKLQPCHMMCVECSAACMLSDLASTACSSSMALAH